MRVGNGRVLYTGMRSKQTILRLIPKPNFQQNRRRIGKMMQNKVGSRRAQVTLWLENRITRAQHGGVSGAHFEGAVQFRRKIVNNPARPDDTPLQCAPDLRRARRRSKGCITHSFNRVVVF